MKQWGSRALRLCVNILILLIAWTVYIQWKIHSMEHQPITQTYDVGIVLGAALWNNEPSPGLRERLDHAYELYKSGLIRQFIVTGGLDYNGSQLTEAEGMRNYLVDLGVPEAHIAIETKARNTYQNIRFSEHIMVNHGWKSAVIITHDFHGARAMEIAEFVGITDPQLSTTGSKVMWMPWHKGRETLAFSKWRLERFLLQLGLQDEPIPQ